MKHIKLGHPIRFLNQDPVFSMPVQLLLFHVMKPRFPLILPGLLQAQEDGQKTTIIRGYHNPQVFDLFSLISCLHLIKYFLQKIQHENKNIVTWNFPFVPPVWGQSSILRDAVPRCVFLNSQLGRGQENMECSLPKDCLETLINLN